MTQRNNLLDKISEFTCPVTEDFIAHEDMEVLLVSEKGMRFSDVYEDFVICPPKDGSSMYIKPPSLPEQYGSVLADVVISGELYPYAINTFRYGWIVEKKLGGGTMRLPHEAMCKAVTSFTVLYTGV